MYVNTLLRLYERERRHVRRVGNNGAEITLIRVADESSDDEQLTEPLFLLDNDER